MKIATWNMHCNFQKAATLARSWQYVVDSDFEIFFVQETKKPSLPNLKFNQENSSPTNIDLDKLVIEEIGGTRKWGSGIYCPNLKIKNLKIKTDYKGWLVAAEVFSEKLSRPLICISLHGMVDKNGYTVPILHRLFSDITTFLAGQGGRTNNIILAGDFNASCQFDKGKKRSHEIFFDRLENYGLQSIYQLAGRQKDEYVDTLRHSNGRKYQIDYIFLSQNLAKKFTNYKIVEDEKIKSLSDHNLVSCQLKF